MKYFILYSACLAVSMYFVDVNSENYLFSVVAPTSVGISITLIIIWLVIEGGTSQIKTNSSDGVPFSNDGDCGGGDC